MKVNLPIEEGYFNIQPCCFCGIDAYLITPDIDAKWNANNLHFRSIILDKKGGVLSCGFKKFFNYLEKPDCYPTPEAFHDWKIEEKKDGSLVIVDYVNGQFSMRTRGTSSYKKQENYKDFELLKEKIPKLEKFASQNAHLSLLFEIITPSNVIVIRPKEVEFVFLNAINKNNLEMVSSEELLEIWRGIGCPPTPEQYYFNDSKNLSKIYDAVKEWKGREGIVLTYNNGQNKLKFKSDWYLFIHRIKSQLNSTNNLIEYYINCGEPSLEDFSKKIEEEYDYEIAVQLKDEIEKICAAGEKAKQKINEIQDYITSIRNLESRKEKAEFILKKYKVNGLSALAFSILDSKKIESKQNFNLVKSFIYNE